MIPVVINNFNRLTTTQKLLEDLKKLHTGPITILDNCSTYLPLLEWYATNPCEVITLDRNHGNMGYYASPLSDKYSHLPWVAYTDSDIELGIETPYNFLEILASKAVKYSVTKAGLALRIDNLPQTPYSQYAYANEVKYWEHPLDGNTYVADVDTTFCIFPPKDPFRYPAIRVAGTLTCIHTPWYLDFDNLSKEEKYYIENSESQYSTMKRFLK